MTWPITIAFLGTLATGASCFALVLRDRASRRLDEESRKLIANQALALGELQKQINDLRVKVGWSKV